MKISRSDLIVLIVLFLDFAAMAYTAGVRELWYAFVGSAILAGPLLVYFWKRDFLSIGAILGIAFLFRLFFLPMLPGLSDDMFRYIWDGLLSMSGINPFHYIPSDEALAAFQSEPFYELLNSHGTYSSYPPVSQGIFWVGGYLYEGDWTISYYAIKGIVATLEFSGILVLSRLISRRSLILLAWHPVVVIAAAGQGHTDAALVLFLGAGIVYALRNRGVATATLLTLAGWIKLFPFFLLPIVWRRFGWKSIVVSVVIGVGLAIPFAASYVPANISASLDLYVRLFEFNAGPYYAVKKLFTLITGDDWSKQLGPAFRNLFFVILAVLYWLDWKKEWPIEKTALLIVGALLLTATTIHPWYYVAVLVLVAVHGKPSWHWQWAALLSIGTYLLYVGGPYWLFVNLTWVGFAVVLAVFRGRETLEMLQRVRSARKARDILWMLGMHRHKKILDLGAGEGYVGEYLSSAYGYDVQLADIIDMNRVELPHVLFDGLRLPLEDNSVDCTILYFVLHHAQNPDRVLSEALRVSRKTVIVVESVYRNRWEHFLLKTFDPIANRLRASRKMKEQEEFLLFKRTQAWEASIRAGRGRLVAVHERWNPIHRKAYFLIETYAGSCSE